MQKKLLKSNDSGQYCPLLLRINIAWVIRSSRCRILSDIIKAICNLDQIRMDRGPVWILHSDEGSIVRSFELFRHAFISKISTNFLQFDIFCISSIWSPAVLTAFNIHDWAIPNLLETTFQWPFYVSLCGVQSIKMSLMKRIQIAPLNASTVLFIKNSWFVFSTHLCILWRLWPSLCIAYVCEYACAGLYWGLWYWFVQLESQKKCACVLYM